MYVLETILKFVVIVLTAIGDFVINAASYPFAEYKKFQARPKRKKVLKSKTFKLKKAPRRQGFTGQVKIKKPLRQVVIILRSVFSSVLTIANNSASAISKPVRLLNSIRFPKARLAHAKSKAKKKARLRTKIIVYKPSVFYKLKYVFIGFLFSFIFLFIPLVSLVFITELPNPSSLSVNYIPKTTKIYDRNGTLLYEIFANQNRTIVELGDVSSYLKQATVAIEDKDFYTHPGFDLRGIIRALVTNVRQEGFQGGSTITQQLIKSAFLTPDPTISRKVKEVALAFWAERIYTKDEILELYLNFVPYGGTAWGAEAASDVYFGKKVSDLTLAEAAFLAGLPRAPSLYSPYLDDTGRWRARQKEVLNAMARDGYITQAQVEEAYSDEIAFKSPDTPLRAPHFVMHVRRLLIERYGISEVERGGLQVVTSLDLEIQNAAQDIVRDEVDANRALNIGNGAALITDPQNGDILAMIGSRDYFDADADGNVNLTTSIRQPGSAIKLVTYALALSQGYTEATVLNDTPLSIPQENGPAYTPVNYDGNYHGRVPLRTAFANSYNIPPVRIAQELGPDSIRAFGEKLGIASWNNATNYGVSITLGGLEVKMTDMAIAYGTVANKGRRVDLNPIVEVRNSTGEVIYEKRPIELPVLDEGVAFIISDILADQNARLQAFGANTPLNIEGRRVSVKTGTTDSLRDNWTIGFTPDVVVATWVGNNDNEPLNQNLASGITGAAPMWNKIMTGLLDKVGTPSSVMVPSNVVRKFCIGQERYFVKGTENSVSCRQAPSGTVSPSPRTN